jgi:cyclase|tara:strand:+ start:13733 stop:14467 length:735 start_codon:yes stop_codon:yes gene_type:complete
MVRSRFIPVLLLDGTGLIKTKQFKRYKYLGDIINALKIFNEKQVDELCIFDLSSSISDGPNFRLLENVARQANMPLCYGGGISSVDQAKRLISIGFEKISLSQMSYSHPELIKEISDAVGSQSVVVTIDVRKSMFTGYSMYVDRGQKKINDNLFDHINNMVTNGVGEICINNIDRDGMRTGYDIELAKKINDMVSVPQTYVGGCGGKQDINALIKAVGPIGVGVGSEYVFRGKLDAVLINYYRA